MPLAIVYTRASNGINAPLVTVEVHISAGMAGLHMVGLAEATVKESKDRVRSALLNSHFDFPARRITINLAPADLPKEGGRFDLPIAIGILVASGQLPRGELEQYELTGELALSGGLRPIKGILPIVLGAYQAKRQLIVPKWNAQEAALLEKASVFVASHLLEVCAHLKKEQTLPPAIHHLPPKATQQLDLADIKGQAHAKRALEIAAAGRHSLLFIGPPGTGKTMLANRLNTLLPPLSEEAALEVAAIASISSSGFKAEDWQVRPFRAPHHSSSNISLVGGGRPPKPGEISLAHHGILFLDELPEFSRPVLESLREPLESGHITISRAAYQTIFPAEFQLIAAMNPCPCGYAGSSEHYCRCSEEQIKRYMAKISGPLLDRIDMHVEVPRLPAEALQTVAGEESSETVKARVAATFVRQYKRQGKCNYFLLASELSLVSRLTKDAENLLKMVVNKFAFSARSYHRLVKIAYTIADLSNSEKVEENHIGEALQFRFLDKTKSFI